MLILVNSFNHLGARCATRWVGIIHSTSHGFNRLCVYEWQFHSVMHAFSQYVSVSQVCGLSHTLSEILWAEAACFYLFISLISPLILISSHLLVTREWELCRLPNYQYSSCSYIYHYDGYITSLITLFFSKGHRQAQVCCQKYLPFMKFESFRLPEYSAIKHAIIFMWYLSSWQNIWCHFVPLNSHG